MLIKETMIKDVTKAFACLSSGIRFGGKLNLTDTHVQSDSFIQDLLNVIYGWQLESTNQAAPNYPCIDLIDKKRSLGVQVSSDNSSAKINDTLICLTNHGTVVTITALKVFILGTKQAKYKINTPCAEVAFDWKNDILDFGDILKAANNLPNSQIQLVHCCVVEAMPDIFPEHRSAQDARRNEFRILDHHDQTYIVGSDACKWFGPAKKPNWIAADPARMSAPWIVAKFAERTDLDLYFASGWGDQGTWLAVDRRTKEGVVINCDQLWEMRQTSATTTTSTTTLPGYVSSGEDEESKAWRLEYRKQLGNHLHETLERINREMPNFEKIVSGRVTSGSHCDAVEVSSFKLLSSQLTKIKYANGYQELISILLTEIARIQGMPSGHKEVTTFLEMIKPLQAKLESEIQGYPPPK